jgi:hypothetical protein
MLAKDKNTILVFYRVGQIELDFRNRLEGEARIELLYPRSSYFAL